MEQEVLYCTECKTVVDVDVTTCPKCGFIWKSARRWEYIPFIVFGMILSLVFYLSSPEYLPLSAIFFIAALSALIAMVVGIKDIELVIFGILLLLLGIGLTWWGFSGGTVTKWLFEIPAGIVSVCGVISIIIGILLLFGFLFGILGAKWAKEEAEWTIDSEAIRGDDADAWNDRGRELHWEGRDTHAIQCYDRALRIAPNHTLAWYNKGLSLNNLGRYAEAVQCYDKALGINPKDADAWNNKGFSLHNLRRDAEAVQCYDRALQINPNHKLARKNREICMKMIGRST